MVIDIRQIDNNACICLWQKDIHQIDNNACICHYKRCLSGFQVNSTKQLQRFKYQREGCSLPLYCYLLHVLITFCRKIRIGDGNDSEQNQNDNGESEHLRSVKNK